MNATAEMRSDAHARQLVERGWNNLAAGYLARTERAEPYLLADVEADVREGRASLFHAERDGALVGCCVLKIDHFARCRELVVQEAAGDLGSAIEMEKFFPLIVDIAVRAGCRFVRAHTKDRPAWAAIFERLNGRLEEIVWRVGL